jgi:hypothetical protein
VAVPGKVCTAVSPRATQHNNEFLRALRHGSALWLHWRSGRVSPVLTQIRVLAGEQRAHAPLLGRTICYLAVGECKPCPVSSQFPAQDRGCRTGIQTVAVASPTDIAWQGPVRHAARRRGRKISAQLLHQQIIHQFFTPAWDLAGNLPQVVGCYGEEKSEKFRNCAVLRAGTCAQREVDAVSTPASTRANCITGPVPKRRRRSCALSRIPVPHFPLLPDFKPGPGSKQGSCSGSPSLCVTGLSTGSGPGKSAFRRGGDVIDKLLRQRPAFVEIRPLDHQFVSERVPRLRPGLVEIGFVDDS